MSVVNQPIQDAVGDGWISDLFVPVRQWHLGGQDYRTALIAVITNLQKVPAFGRLLLRLSRVDVLLLDDFAMAPLKDTERRDFLEICDDRYQRRSVILTSQMPLAHWHEQIGDPTIADSILDRLIHNAYRIDLNGESIRKKRRKPGQEDPQ